MSRGGVRSVVAGRPRRVTDADIAEILRWHRCRETRQELAQRLELSVTTVATVVRSQGKHYKTPSPRPALRVEDRARRRGRWRRR